MSAQPDDLLNLQNTSINIADVLAFVTSDHAGGIDIFLGTTRAENSTDARQLIALDYEAYNEMAIRQFQALSAEARTRWPILKLTILHRIGRVPVGQASVVIAVSTPHRAQAFEACRWLIDELKKQVTIWKQEVWEDGSKTWVDPTPIVPPQAGL